MITDSFEMISCKMLLLKYHYYNWTGVESSYFFNFKAITKKNISYISESFQYNETPQIGNTFLEKGFCETSLNTECYFIGVIT